MKNSADQGRCYPQRPFKAEVDNPSFLGQRFNNLQWAALLTSF